MYFRIDHRDRVVEVGDEWRTFADATGVDQLFPGAKLGSPYRDTIHNPQIAEMYRTLLKRVRLRRDVVRFPLRADTARERRFLEMEIEAVTGGGVDFRLELDRFEPRSPGEWVSPPEEDEMIRMCTFCQRAQWDLEWMELEKAIRAGDLFGDFKYWQISHGSCPDCLKERMLEITGG